MIAATCLAFVIYFEARNQPEAAQFAVAEVTIQRVKDDRWPNTICGVVFQPNQYKWAKNKPPIRDAKAWRKSQRIANIVLNNHIGAAISCSDHFHDDSETPGWTQRMALELTIGRIRS